MQMNDLATMSLAGEIAEAKITLWSADGTTAQPGSNYPAGQEFLNDGGIFSNTSSSAWKLFTFGSEWPSGQQFSFEATIELVTSPATGNAALWDLTSNTMVSASQVSTTTLNMETYRSGKFTLTPGHDYGVTVWSSAYNTAICDASLIVFP